MSCQTIPKAAVGAVFNLLAGAPKLQKISIALRQPAWARPHSSLEVAAISGGCAALLMRHATSLTSLHLEVSQHAALLDVPSAAASRPADTSSLVRFSNYNSQFCSRGSMIA